MAEKPEQNSSNNTKSKTPRIWHPQHEKVLKAWGESAACYRYLHYRAYQMYKLMNMRFTLPVIVLSTVTGTANFAQQTFPKNWQLYVPSVIGALNLIAAIMTTVQQFLKTSELMESHRVSSLNYGKFTRNIRLEITLPVDDRTHHGGNFIEICAAEYDRLLQQCPPIPGVIMKIFDAEFPEKPDVDKFVKFSRPDILSIKPIQPYNGIFDNILGRILKKSTQSKTDNGRLFGARSELAKELESLRERTLVSKFEKMESPDEVDTPIRDSYLAEFEAKLDEISITIPSHPAFIQVPERVVGQGKPALKT